MALPSLAVLQLAHPAGNRGDRMGEDTMLT